MDANTPVKKFRFFFFFSFFFVFFFFVFCFVFFFRCNINVCDEVKSVNYLMENKLNLSFLLDFIISPNIRSKVGKQGSAQAHSVDFYRNGSYFLQYTQDISKRAFCNDLYAFSSFFICFSKQCTGIILWQKEKNNAGYYGTSWINGHSRFTRCGVCFIFTHDVMLVPTNLFHVGVHGMHIVYYEEILLKLNLIIMRYTVSCC